MEEKKAGRPLGSKSKGVDALRKRIATLTERNYPVLSEALELVRNDDPAKFVELYLKLLQYTLPRLESIKSTVEVGDDTINKISIQIVKGEKPDTNE